MAAAGRDARGKATQFPAFNHSHDVGREKLGRSARWNATTSDFGAEQTISRKFKRECAFAVQLESGVQVVSWSRRVSRFKSRRRVRLPQRLRFCPMKSVA